MTDPLEYKTVAEERQALMDLGKELITTMRQIIEPINKLTCKLDAHASMLLPEVMREKTQGSRVRKIIYKKEDGSETTIEAPAEGTIKSFKRACSICRQPGHRATTCPVKPESHQQN